MSQVMNGLRSIRNYAYGGAGASFALLLVLFSLEKLQPGHEVAVIGAALAVPHFVAAGWMADEAIAARGYAETAKTEDHPLVFSLVMGSCGLFAGVLSELWRLDRLAAALFVLSIAVIWFTIERHRKLLMKPAQGQGEKT